MNRREAYRQKMEAQLEEAAAHLTILKARAKRALAEGRIHAHDELGITDDKIAALKSKLKEFGNSSEHAWEEMKVGVEGAWEELLTASKKAADKFKKETPPVSQPAPSTANSGTASPKATQVEPS